MSAIVPVVGSIASKFIQNLAKQQGDKNKNENPWSTLGMSAANSGLNLGTQILGAGAKTGIEAMFQSFMQKRYNSPQAQMSNMIAAGINPYTASQGIAGVANGPSSGSVINPGNGNIVNDAATIANSNLDPTVKDNLVADTEEKRANAAVSNADAGIKEDNRESIRRSAYAKAAGDEATAKILSSDASVVDQLNSQKIEQGKQIIDNLKKEWSVMEQNIRESGSRTRLNNLAADKDNFVLQGLKKYGVDPGSLEGQMVIAEMNGDKERSNAILKAYELVEDSKTEGKETAESRHDYGKFVDTRAIETVEKADEVLSNLRDKKSRLIKDIELNGGKINESGFLLNYDKLPSSVQNMFDEVLDINDQIDDTETKRRKITRRSKFSHNNKFGWNKN